MGHVTGGFGYVIASYTITWAALIAYSLALAVRRRSQARNPEQTP